MENRKVGEVCYFKRGGYFGKCVITEVITVIDEKGTIVNYKIRLYGKDKILQVALEEIFDSFEDARNYLLTELEGTYTKQTEIIKNDKESKFDAWEAEYQAEKDIEGLKVKEEVKNNDNVWTN